jgi:A/G-specific adenine glycosylase
MTRRQSPITDHRSPITGLLAWYDRSRRDLPWRARPGEKPDPYAVWLSEVMLQQTTVAAVKPYFAAFLARWPDVRDLAAAPREEVMKAWAGLGYYSRARNLHACAAAVAAREGASFPDTEQELRRLPGLGPYTAAAVAAIAFGRRAVVVDGNVERVVARLFAVADPPPRGKRLMRAHADALTPEARAGDFAQAMMDLGATICSPRKPVCALCPWNEGCAAFARGDAGTFPRRTPKREGALRRGAAFVARRADGYLLLRTRLSNGLLGGMTEVPTTAWSADFDEGAALKNAPIFSRQLGGESGMAWRRMAGVVRHVFTHFPLELSIYVADVAAGTPAPEGARWAKMSELGGEALPSLMRKVVAHALDEAGITPRPIRRARARARRR